MASRKYDNTAVASSAKKIARLECLAGPCDTSVNHKAHLLNHSPGYHALRVHNTNNLNGRSGFIVTLNYRIWTHITYSNVSTKRLAWRASGRKIGKQIIETVKTLLIRPDNAIACLFKEVSIDLPLVSAGLGRDKDGRHLRSLSLGEFCEEYGALFAMLLYGNG